MAEKVYDIGEHLEVEEIDTENGPSMKCRGCKKTDSALFASPKCVPAAENATLSVPAVMVRPRRKLFFTDEA